MIDPHGEPAVGESPAKLEEAPGVAARDHTGPRARDPVELPLEELPGDLRLHQVVDARRSAAEVRLGQIDEPEPRDRAEERPGRLPHALAVGQVARLVIGHREIERSPRLRQVLGEELADVAHPRGEGGRPGVVLEEVPVVAEQIGRASCRERV